MLYAELFLQTKVTLVKDGPRKIKNSNALDSLFADLDQDLEQQYEEEEFEFFLMGKSDLNQFYPLTSSHELPQ